MDYDEGKVDEMVLALLYLTTFRDKLEVRACKGLDWDSLNRLYEKGYLSDPRSKAKSVMLSQEGEQLSEELFRKHFGKADEGAGWESLIQSSRAILLCLSPNGTVEFFRPVHYTAT